ncbi:two-component response regulator-like PRR37 [Gastrolobium bilobum]|uniref:two-component response regulator-like PRR37 n=1 Tax=Gastrolobium bilobum TaxID=150636 RepID=UPI002AB232F6|nr:two-component response regulator-like PRR37 [Gastrolobium bilobum]
MDLDLVARNVGHLKLINSFHGSRVSLRREAARDDEKVVWELELEVGGSKDNDGVTVGLNAKPWILKWDEISSPISARIFELCDTELFQETLQNFEGTSNSNCGHEENSSYTTNISLALDVDNKINSNSNIVTTPSSNIATTTNTNTNNNTTKSSNMCIIFDSQEEIDNDTSASIDFSSSPAFVVPLLLPITTTQQEQFDFYSSSGSVLKGLSQYPTNPVVAPLIGAPLSSVFEDDCISSIPSYVSLNPSSPSCSYLSPGLGVSYMPPRPLNTAESSGLFGGSILLGSELQTQELDYQGENGGICCTDSIQRVFNQPDLQAFGSESQKLVAGAGSSATLAPEISSLEDSTLKVGKLSVEQRKEKIHRYMKKRNERNFSKKIKYACRKTLADSRPRVRGRFAKNDDFAESHGPACSNHEKEIVMKEDDDMVDSSDIFAHISGVNSFKCNYSIQSWI